MGRFRWLERWSSDDEYFETMLALREEVSGHQRIPKVRASALRS